MTTDPSHTIGATTTSIAVFEYLVEADCPVGVSQISADLDIAKSMAYNHLSTLRDRGYVTKRDRQYAASLRPLMLGEQIRSSIEVYERGREEIENLAEATGEVVELFIMEERYGAPVSIVRGSDGWSSPHRVGERMPLHVTAAGKAILASLSDEELAEFLDGYPLTAFTDETVTDAVELKEEIREVRESGVSFCREEQYEGVVGVGASIGPGVLTAPAALAIIGPADRLYGRYFEEDLVGQVVSTAKAIEVALTE